MKRLLIARDGGGMWGAPVADLDCQVEVMLGYPLVRDAAITAGTSTGGLRALAEACEVPAGTVRDFYYQRGPQIFRPIWWRRAGLTMARYPASELESALRDIFGTLRLGDVKHQVMVTSVRISDRRTKIWKSWQASDQDIPIWKVARATSAAPTFFEPVEIDGEHYVDGGVAANNPSMVVATEARSLWPEDDPYILNFGTGQFQRPSARHKTWGLLDWGPMLANLFMDSGFDLTTYESYAWARTYRCDFSRAQYGANPGMDCAGPSQMNALSLIGTDHRRRAKDVLDFLAQAK